MKARDLLVYLSVKYEGDFSRMLEAIKNKEPADPKEIDKVVASLPEGVKTLTILDEDVYPAALKQCLKCPLVLFYYGNLDLIKKDDKCVSYVGDKEASPLGLATATRLGTVAAKHGFTIVSSLAKGISETVMKAALKAGGKVVGVLGSGIDTCYPSSSKKLYEELKTKGLVISEYPPKTEPKMENFPMRNRIIAAISHSLVVGEAGPKSGCLITVGYALDMNKDVGCVPCAAGQESSCNKLIHDGAYLIDTDEDFLDLVTNGNTCLSDAKPAKVEE
jgi:DNA processing protein